MIYDFFWGNDADESFLMEIDADLETVETLLDEYRASDPEEYNNDGWEKFLEEKGFKIRGLTPDHHIYF